MANNYNSIANVYDVLSKTIFKTSIIVAQVFLLQHIKPNSEVLIVGGGTGWILEELSKIHSQGINITYVEKSAKMIALSKQKNIQQNTVEFVNKDIEEFTTGKKFDVVFTAFFFDNFQPQKIEIIFSKLNDLLAANGLWLYADFVISKQSKWWQKILLKTMYLFFRITTKIETQQLVEMSTYYSLQYQKLKEKFFYSNFIKAVVYTKNLITISAKQYREN